MDGAFSGQDEDGDTTPDEPLPFTAADFDCDGDGYTGAAESSIFAPATDRDQDPCGLDGWPSNPFDSAWSANRPDIQDVISFVAPTRHLDTSPGDAGFDLRWDLAPAPGGGVAQINMQDITALIVGATAYPPMFGGERAFYRTCPWPG